jgi:hypothetical protein
MHTNCMKKVFHNCYVLQTNHAKCLIINGDDELESYASFGYTNMDVQTRHWVKHDL